MKKKYLIISSVIILLFGIWIIIGCQFIGITKSYYIQSEMLIPYEENATINCHSYVALSPFGSNAYDYDTGEVILDSDEISNYEKSYNIYDTATGTPYYGCSGGFGTPNPTLQEMVPSVSYEDWNNVLNCAEMDAVNNALNDGAYTGYLEIVTITRRSGDVRNMCSNCFYSFAGNAYTPTESGFVGLSR